MYHDTKTSEHRLGRTPHTAQKSESKTLIVILTIITTALFIGAMHGDYIALQAGIIN